MPTPPPEVIQQFQQTSLQIILYGLGLAFLLLLPIGFVLFLRRAIWDLSRRTLQPTQKSPILGRDTRASSLARDPEDLLKLTPREFENMVADLYRANGYRAWRTGATGDHGVDVVIQTGNGEKWVAQCKRWRGAVGEPVVRDFYGVMQHEKADKGAIVTTGTFTPQARAWAKGKPIFLYDGNEFLAAWKEARERRSPSSNVTSPITTLPLEANQATTKADTAPLCPKCGSKMILRVASRGEHKGEPFYGCSQYPKCQGVILDLKA